MLLTLLLAYDLFLSHHFLIISLIVCW